MADSVKESCVKNLKTTLETVTEANGYANTIQSVQRATYRGQTSLAKPYIVIEQGPETAEDTNNIHIGKRLQVALLIYWSQLDTDDRSTDEYLNSLQADIEKAVMGNRMLNGKAIDVSPIGAEEMDLVNEQGVIVELVFALTFEISYRHNMADPYTET